MRSPTADLLVDAINRLNDAVALHDVVLAVTEPNGLTRWNWVRRSGEVIVQTTDLEAEWSFQVYADDPLKLHQELSATTALPSTTGGLTIPYTVPFTIGATTVSGQVSLTNPGNEAGPVRLRSRRWSLHRRSQSA